MFAPHFDTFQRKTGKDKVIKICTVFKGTPECDAYTAIYLDPASDLHLCIEDDNSTYTFWRAVWK